MRLILVLCLLIPACAPAPQIVVADAGAAARAPFPALVPLDAFLDGVPAAATDPAPDVSARVARLRARAAALRGAVVDPATRARMGAGVSG